jgi:CheY-like chemotaxis protein
LNKVIISSIDLTKNRWKDIPESEGIVIEVKNQLQPDLPVIKGNESEIRSALTNLILNSADALPDGGTIILKSIANKDDVIVEVQDTGFGMDEETQRRCFDPFYTTKGEKGTGLGLSMVYGTMQRHEGHIEIETQKGKGTSIRLFFPKQDIDHVFISSKESMKSLPPLKILCIDDDESNREMLLSMLGIKKHHVILSSNGKDGVKLFLEAFEQAKSFDIVITDLGMPYMDGKSVAKSIKNISPGTPIILITGWGAFIENGSIKCVDYILSKPVVIKELYKAIETVLELKNNKSILN